MCCQKITMTVNLEPGTKLPWDRSLAVCILKFIGVMAKNLTARSPESKRLIEVKAKNQTTRSPENRVIMLEAMKQRGKSLRYATCEHETDREFMLEAMEQRRNSLKHAAPEHKFGPGLFY